MFALLTPQENPTVEREMRALLPPGADYVTGRLVSAEPDATERLHAYAHEMPAMMAQFGKLRFDAVLFACTGSSYLISRGAEAAIAARVAAPVIWATAAIRAEMARRGARRIAIISPYPSALHDAATAYWRVAGFEVAFDARVETGSADTRAIYTLTGDEAAGAIAAARAAAPDLILLSGTGMPTLAALRPDATIPVISSNYCLARAAALLKDAP